MPIANRVVQAQLAAVKRRLGARWTQRYPSYTHDKNHPALLPKLFCRIVAMEYSPDTVTVKAHISNVGSGASYNSRVQFYYVGLIAQAHGQPPPPPLHQLLELKESKAIAIQPGETQEIAFSAAHPNVHIMMSDWLAVVLCYDPTTDPLPMNDWHTLLQPVGNLLLGGENPPTNPPIPHWEEFDSPASAQPRVGNRTWKGRTTNPDPAPRMGADGRPVPNRSYFAPYASAAVSELRQIASLGQFEPVIDQGNLVLTLRGLVRSYGQQDPDQTQIILECMDVNGDVLNTLDLGQHAFTDAWHMDAGTIMAPVGTRQARVRLRSTRRSGRNNDGYFDAVRLAPSHRQIATALRSSFI